jgi:hypothetical protein
VGKGGGGLALEIESFVGGVASRDQESVQIADSPTRRYGESIFDYEYLHEFEAKIETA